MMIEQNSLYIIKELASMIWINRE